MTPLRSLYDFGCRLSAAYDADPSLYIGRYTPIQRYDYVPMSYVLVLNARGELVDILDIRRVRPGKASQANPGLIAARVAMPVDIGVTRSSNIVADLLWGNLHYVLGISRDAKDPNGLSYKASDITRIPARHEAFKVYLTDLPAEVRQDRGVAAVLLFLASHDPAAFMASSLNDRFNDERTGNVTFALNGDDDAYIAQRNCVVTAHQNTIPKSKPSVCLITGEVSDMILPLHPSISGIGDKMNMKLVSFQNDSTHRLGLSRETLAPISYQAGEIYSKAANYLLANSQYRTRVGDEVIIAWKSGRFTAIDPIKEVVYGSGIESHDPTIGDPSTIKGLLTAATRHQEVDGDDTNYTYLVLKAQGARITVADKFEGSMSDVQGNIARWFDDLALGQYSKRLIDVAKTSSLRQVMSSLSGGRASIEAHLETTLGQSFTKASLTNGPLDSAFLERVISRLRKLHSSSAAKTEACAGAIHTLTAMAKLILIRNYGAIMRKELDIENLNVGYLLGRLLAEYEKAQGDAQADRKLNRSVVDSQWSKFSTYPLVAKPQLDSRFFANLKRIGNETFRNATRRRYEDIQSQLLHIPMRLSLQDQAMFATGFVHQKAYIYTSKKPKELADETDSVTVAI